MFSIDVASAPTFLHPTTPMWDQPLDELRAYDEDLVKPLVLFADKITLRSERVDMMSLLKSSAFSASVMPLRRVLKYVFASLKPDPEELALYGLTVDVLADAADAAVVRDALRPDQIGRSGSGDDLLRFEEKYGTRMIEFTDAVVGTLRGRWESLSSPDLQQLAGTGILEIKGWAAGRDSPFELAWREELEFLLSSMDDLEHELSGSNGAVMLEPGSQFFLSSKIMDEQGNSGRGINLPSTMAASFINRLPGLQSASLSELIDVRNDLSDYLVPFRASMANMAKDVSDSSGESPDGILVEIERRWSSEIAPVIHELGVKTRRGGYPRELLNVLTQDKGSLASSATAITLAAGSVAAGLSALIPAAAAATYPFVKALKETLRERESRQDNRLYLLYAAQQRLARR